MLEESHGSQRGSIDRDAADLARLGKKPVLKRRFGFMSLLGFSCTILITWEGILIGGPAGLVYQFLIVWIGTASVYTCLSELASMAPTAGGQYYWVSMLAPPSSRKFFSYATGWLTVWGWQVTLASVYYLAGALIQGLITLTTPAYEPHPWHTVLLFWAGIVFTISINTAAGQYLPKFEGSILVIHILGFFAVLLPLAIMGSHQNASEVFKTFLNTGGWSTQGLSFMIGMLGSVFCFTGADGAIHMSEEIQNASVVVPRAIMFSIFINGSLAFCMLITTFFSLTDVQGALNTPTHYPIMEILQHSTGSVAAATVLASILVVMQFCANVGILASTSRMCWSFARDRGLPGWKFLQRVEGHASLPIRSILVTTCISCLLSLIILGSSTAFNDLVSLSVSSLQSSYLVAISLLLYRRCTGAILPRSSSVESYPVADLTIRWGSWHVAGCWGIANNVFACTYLTVMVFFSFWPTERPVTAENMNYAVLVTGAVVIVSLVYYLVWAKRVYTGPVIEVG
ncbi:putative GABA permease [Usnea florida]